MKKSEKILTAAGTGTSAVGVATAVGGKAALWSIFSAGPGAALTGAAETNAFLAWVGGGSLAAGGGGMAAGAATLAILKRTGWGLALVGAAATGIGIGLFIKRKKQQKRLNENGKEQNK